MSTLLLPADTSTARSESATQQHESTLNSALLSEQDQKRLRQAEAHHLATELGVAESVTQRIKIYRQTTIGLLNVAAALWPELMPKINGEFEWIALLTADLD